LFCVLLENLSTCLAGPSARWV